jgi:SAM-dependent methyltransferase
MAKESAIIGIDHWLTTPPGRYLVAWEQARLDALVSNLFGYHAVQLGWPALQGLRCNRMSHRWLVTDGSGDPGLAGWVPEPLDDMAVFPPAPLPLSVLAEYDALPFPSNSLDLVVLPHTLELAADPHETLREVERVLMPEGRVIVIGFNPASLWGAYKAGSDVAARLGWTQPAVPGGTELIGWRRLRDWLRLLGFEHEGGQFGCWRPPLASASWLERTAWLDQAGPRWWPVLGSAYVMVAVKRVKAMRLVGKAWKRRPAAKAATAAVASHQAPEQALNQALNQARNSKP